MIKTAVLLSGAGSRFFYLYSSKQELRGTQKLFKCSSRDFQILAFARPLLSTPAYTDKKSGEDDPHRF
jgi:hypothetical protein